jgi:hypothetical protein
VDAILIPANPDQPAVRDLRRGDLVELALSEWIAEPGVWLPISALTQGSRGLWSAYALDATTDDAASARLEVRPLEVIYQEGDRVFVRGALAAGEHLVAAGLHRVVPGQRVRPLPEGAALAATRGTAGDGEAQ